MNQTNIETHEKKLSCELNYNRVVNVVYQILLQEFCFEGHMNIGNATM